MKMWMSGVLLILPVLVYAQSNVASHFRIIDFKLKGRIENVIPADLDQDGVKELLVIHHYPALNPSHRYLSVYWALPGGRYAPNQVVEVEIPQRFTLFDFGNLPGQPGEVVIMVSRNTAEYYRYENKTIEGPLPLLNFSNQLIQISDPDQLLYYDFLYDWNNDGKNEIMIYQIGDADLFYFQDGKWIKTTIDLPMSARYFSITPLRRIFPHSELSVHYSTPNMFISDREGDGKSELFVIEDENIWIFRQNEKGIYEQKPSIKLKMNLTDPKEQARRRDQLTLTIVDIDDDGKADLISNYQHGSFFNQKADLKIFYGKDRWTDLGPKAKPGRAWALNSWVIGPFVKDMNADKSSDMVMPTIQIGVISAAQVLIANNFPFEFKYYLSINHTLPPEPTYVDQVRLYIDFKEGKLSGGFPNIFGDFNGDGIDDLVFSKNDQEMVVVIKDRQSKRTDKQEIIKIATAILPLVEDVNGDGLGDIILTYPMDTERPNEFKLLINQGNW